MIFLKKSAVVMFSIFYGAGLYYASADTVLNENVTASEGHEASLSCPIDSDNGDTPIDLYWFRRNLTTTTLMYRLVSMTPQSSVHSGKHIKNPEWKHKALFSVLSKPTSLKLRQLQHNDSALYDCCILFKSGKWKNITAKLFVSVGPNATLRWYRNNRRILDTVTRRTSDSLGWMSTLTIGPLSRDFLLSTFRCDAQSDFSLGNSTHTTLEMLLAPSVVKVRSWHAALYLGVPQEMECEVWGSRPEVRVQWFLNNKPLPPPLYSDTSFDGNYSNSVIVIVPREEDYKKSLECRAGNPKLPNSTVSDFFLLDIKYKPEVILTLGSGLNKSCIVEESDVYFECNAFSLLNNNQQTNAVVMWSFNGIPINSSQGYLMSNRYLVIRGVQRRHRGSYTCTLESSAGTAQSAPMDLIVHAPPLCESPLAKRIQVGVNTTANITCDIDSVGDDILNVTWMITPYRGTPTVLTTTVPSLSFYVNQDSLYSTVSCRATNSAGVQALPCRTRILPLGNYNNGSNLVYCTVDNVTETSLYVKCNTLFTSRVTRKNAAPSSAVSELRSGSENSLWIHHLFPDTEYQIVIIVSENASFSDVKNNITVTLLARTLPSQNMLRSAIMEQTNKNRVLGDMWTAMRQSWLGILCLSLLVFLSCTCALVKCLPKKDITVVTKKDKLNYNVHPTTNKTTCSFSSPVCQTSFDDPYEFG